MELAQCGCASAAIDPMRLTTRSVAPGNRPGMRSRSSIVADVWKTEPNILTLESCRDVEKIAPVTARGVKRRRQQ